MIREIKKYLGKYHEANLWLEQANVREEKKHALESVSAAEIELQPAYETVLQHPQVVFTHYDTGHNQEETNTIQKLYNELEDLVRVPRLTFV